MTMTRKSLCSTLALWGAFYIRCESAFCSGSGVLKPRLTAVLRDVSFNHFQEAHHDTSSFDCSLFTLLTHPRRAHAFCCQAHWPCICNAELHRLPLARYADSCNRRVSVSHVTLDLQRNCRFALSLPTKPVGRPSCLEVAFERARHKPNSRQSQLASAFQTDPESPISPGSGTAVGGFVFVFDVRQQASRKCRPIFYMSAQRMLIQPHGCVPKTEIYSVG